MKRWLVFEERTTSRAHAERPATVEKSGIRIVRQPDESERPIRPGSRFLIPAEGKPRERKVMGQRALAASRLRVLRGMPSVVRRTPRYLDLPWDSVP